MHNFPVAIINGTYIFRSRNM